MRKIPAALAVLGLSAVALTGCAVPFPDTCPRPASTPSDLYSVTGGFGTAPQVEVSTPLHVAHTEVEDVIVGDGNPIRTDAQLIVADLTIVDGNTGETLVQSAYDGDLSRGFQLQSLAQNVPAFSSALRCATEGSRVVVGLAPGDIEPSAAASLKLGDTDSAIAVVDLDKVYLSRAEGTLVFNQGGGLPSVVRAPDGTPGVTIPDSAPPAKTTFQTLIHGDGEVVTGDQPIRINYTGITWQGARVFDTTWGAAPASVTLDGIAPGIAKALEGQTVGSQVLVVLSPEDVSDKGLGKQLPPEGNLVFVVDILGLDPAA